MHAKLHGYTWVHDAHNAHHTPRYQLTQATSVERYINL